VEGVSTRDACGYTRTMTENETADGSSLRDDSHGLAEDADGSNYRVEEADGSEPADGSSLRDDSGTQEETADGSNYRPSE